VHQLTSSLPLKDVLRRLCRLSPYTVRYACAISIRCACVLRPRISITLFSLHPNPEISSPQTAFNSQCSFLKFLTADSCKSSYCRFLQLHLRPQEWIARGSSPPQRKKHIKMFPERLTSNMELSLVASYL
jgi:hypothetical protein